MAMCPGAIPEPFITSLETFLEIQISHMRLPGPHFPILNRRLGRKHLSPEPFSKKMAQVPKPAKTSKISLAHGHDLTFPSRVQSVVEKICCHTHFEKNERQRSSLSQHVRFF